MICAILSPKNMHVIEEIRGKSGLCLIIAPRLTTSFKHQRVTLNQTFTKPHEMLGILLFQTKIPLI